LKESFSRFNFALYKEKEMADFRRWFIALAVLALMAGLASAQVVSAVGGRLDHWLAAQPLHQSRSSAPKVSRSSWAIF